MSSGADPLTLVAHADWSTQPSKRRLARARLQDDGTWLALPVERVGEPATLLERLMHQAGGGAVLVGFDLPIGLPLAYAQKAGITRFTDLLPCLGFDEWSEFFQVAEQPGDISLHRPFYPMRPTITLPGGEVTVPRQQHLLDGLGLTSMADLRRLCDQPRPDRRAASPIFWTLGGQQVGKAAIHAWKGLIQPALSQGQPTSLWPFDGRLLDLLKPGRVVVAEAYPGEYYAHLGVRFRAAPSSGAGPKYGKRSFADRAANAPALLGWAAQKGVRVDSALAGQILAGFGLSPAGEDDFDALVGLFGILNVALGFRSPGDPPRPEQQYLEGWILGQGGL